MAIRTLCEAGRDVCAINAGRRLDPQKDFRHHRMPWDMQFRGFGDPAQSADRIGYMDNEWVNGVWEHEIAYTTAPGSPFANTGTKQFTPPGLTSDGSKDWVLLLKSP